MDNIYSIEKLQKIVLKSLYDAVTAKKNQDTSSFIVPISILRGDDSIFSIRDIISNNLLRFCFIIDGKKLTKNSIVFNNNKLSFKGYNNEPLIIIDNCDFINVSLENMVFKILSELNTYASEILLMSYNYYNDNGIYNSFISHSNIIMLENEEYDDNNELDAYKQHQRIRESIKYDRITLKRLVESYGKKDVLNFVRHLK